jgi:hypothetical protein
MSNITTKREKFYELPSLTVNSAHLQKIWDEGQDKKGRGEKNDFYSKALEWVNSLGIAGKNYKNQDKEWEIQFTRKSADNVLQHHAGIQKAAMLEIVPKLIENGIYLESIPKNDKGLITHVFACKAKIDGNEYAVSFAVREDNNGRRYYDHNFIETKALDRFSQAPDERVSRISDHTKGGTPESLNEMLIRHLQ